MKKDDVKRATRPRPSAEPPRDEPIEKPPEEHDLGALADAARRTVSMHIQPTDAYPDHLPPGYRMRGVSILKDDTGHTRLTWIKTAVDPDWHVGGTDECVVPAAVIPAPDHLCDDQLAVYPIGDPHIGMHAWNRDAGGDFDLDIALRLYLGASMTAFRKAPVGSDALLIDLGDFYHFDDALYRTSSGRVTVDADSRYQKVVHTGQRIADTLLEAALTQHRKVTWWTLRGNHDAQASVALYSYLRGRWGQHPRVTIDDTAGKFHYLRWHSNLLAATHGENARKRRATLHECMTVDRRQDWGETRHAKWHIGHVHHTSKTEAGGVEQETYRILAPNDAWHQAQGYRAARDIRVEIWHKEYGHTTTHITTPQEIEAALQEAAL